MNKKTKTAAAALVPAVMFLALATPAFATTVSAGAGVKLQAKMAAADAKSETAITKRISDMQAAEARLAELKHLTDSQKASIKASLDAEIAAMQALQAKIHADTDAAAKKADIESITKDNRVYALVLPQARILAAANGEMTVAAMMSAMGTKLQARITEAQAAGKDTASLSASLADMNAKVADANAKAQAAVSMVANLAPDGGDKAKMDANETALKGARADIKAAEQDLRTARADIKAILLGVKGTGASAHVSASSETH